MLGGRGVAEELGATRPGPAGQPARRPLGGLEVAVGHGKEDRLLLSGTLLRKTLSEGGDPPADFSRPEVLAILKDYYANLQQKVEVKLHQAATGDVKKD